MKIKKTQSLTDCDLELLGSRDVVGHVNAGHVFRRLSIMTMCLSCAPQTFRDHDFDLLGPRDVIGRVTIRLVVGHFLWVVHCDHVSMLHLIWRMKFFLFLSFPRFSPLWRYCASNIGRTDVDTERKMEEGKEKREGQGERKGEGEGKVEGR